MSCAMFSIRRLSSPLASSYLSSSESSDIPTVHARNLNSLAEIMLCALSSVKSDAVGGHSTVVGGMS